MSRTHRLREVWWRTAGLSWPIAVQQFLNTLMRTVDVFVTGLFSPAAVAAVGLADLYTDLPRRVGSSLGTAVLALSSQDTGRGATASRDVAATQALLIGFLAGLPFVAGGLLLNQLAIAVLGAEPSVVRLGATYLAVVLAVAPFRIVGYVGASALQGTGDTRTPMVVNGGANALNIVLTLGLGLGLGGLPRLGVLGVGLATAASRVLEAGAMVAAIHSPRTELSFARPRSLTVARQLVVVSLPRFGEQVSMGVVLFPFNALVLLFGTEANAAFQIGRRVYHQLGGPLYRAESAAASIIVGQTMGAGNGDDARFVGYAIVALGLLVLGPVALGMFLGAPWLADLFTDDPTTVGHTIGFIRAFAVVLLTTAVLFGFAGSLRGAGDTRTPFYAQFTGRFALMLGFSYVVGVTLGVGLLGVYAGLVLTYVWAAVVVGYGFVRGTWQETAEALIDERAGAVD